MNAEFRRSLWLELSMHRLIAMPVALALVLALVYAMSDDPWESIAVTAAWIGSALLGRWGVRSTAESVGDEMRARTWDAQRMSALGPWSMTWGKLFGAGHPQRYPRGFGGSTGRPAKRNCATGEQAK